MSHNQPAVTYLGIDLTSSALKPSACVGFGEEMNLVVVGLLRGDNDLIAAVEGNHPRLVTIDAPLGLPQGLCCLEEICSCFPKTIAKGRSCERELAKMGIPCYFTTKRSIIKTMVYRAIGLKKELNRRGYQVLEVYPYASKVRLFGKPLPPKNKPSGINFLRERLAVLMPHLAEYVTSFNHDLCDAAVAAYTAYLYHQGKAELLGIPQEGTICLPYNLAR